jgi:AsmA protein
MLCAALVPVLCGSTGTDDSYPGASLMAAPRDTVYITEPIRFGVVPGLTLLRGALYAPVSTTSSSISRIDLDSAVFDFDVSAGRADSGDQGNLPEGDAITDVANRIVAPLVEQLCAGAFEILVVRRGTLTFHSTLGTAETVSDLQAEVSPRRKGALVAQGMFNFRGQRLTFEGMLGQPTDKRVGHAWPLKFTIKTAVFEASFDGRAGLESGLELQGNADFSVANLPHVARMFGVPVYPGKVLNALHVKGLFDWARGAIAFEKAEVNVDGNEASGAVALSLVAHRPTVEATLAFASFDVGPYLTASPPLPSIIELPIKAWQKVEISMPLIKHIDADLRVSAGKVTVNGTVLGRGAVTLAAKSGHLLADVAELEIGGGRISAQITADMTKWTPRYALRGKIEDFEIGPATMGLFGFDVLTGRSMLAFDVAGTGQSAGDVMRRLSGRATLTMPEGGRLAVDVNALRQQGNNKSLVGWGPAAKGQTSFDRLEARAVILDGVVVAEAVHGRSGMLGLAATGAINVPEHKLDVRLHLKPNVPIDQPVKLADILAGESVSLQGPWHEPVVRVEEATPLP